MGGVGDTIVRGLTDVATFGTAEIANAATGGGLYGPGGYLQRFGNSNPNGSGPANPPGIGPEFGQEDPSGMPLLSQVALGTPVDDALGALYGIKPGSDFEQWSQKLSPDDLRQIVPVRAALQNVQSDITLRNQLVTNIINGTPQIMAQELQKAGLGLNPAVTDADRAVLNQAADQLSAKYNAQGGFSSGAFNEGLAKESVALYSQKQQQAYEEARAQQSFQQQMLGQQSQNIYNARQAAIDRINQNFQQQQSRQFQTQQGNRGFVQGLFGTAGTLAGLYGLSQLGGAGAGAGGGAGAGLDTAFSNTYGPVGGPLSYSQYGQNPYG